MNLTLIRGLPGSGKSTLAERLTQADNTAHFEADMYFTDENGNYEFQFDNLAEAHDWCREQTEEHLRMEYDVIVSNTFVTPYELRKYFEIAKKFDITPTVILCQNDWGNIHDTPAATLLNMQKRFQYDIDELFKEFK